MAGDQAQKPRLSLGVQPWRNAWVRTEKVDLENPRPGGHATPCPLLKEGGCLSRNPASDVAGSHARSEGPPVDLGGYHAVYDPETCLGLGRYREKKGEMRGVSGVCFLSGRRGLCVELANLGK